METPQEEKKLKIEISIGRRGAVMLVAGLLILLLPIIPTTESLTLTTYYPAPYGAYQELRSTQSSFLAYLGGQVGIGTSTPAYLLDIDGDAQVRGDLRVNGSLLLSGYITLAQPVCASVDIGGATTSCPNPANQYATIMPGLYQEGETKLTQTKWMYQDGTSGTPKSWPEPGGSFWCCNK